MLFYIIHSQPQRAVLRCYSLGNVQCIFLLLTFNLLFWCFDVAQHPGHVDAVPVHVLEKDVCVSSGQSARLIEISTHVKIRDVT